jgi:hypothetical protein
MPENTLNKPGNQCDVKKRERRTTSSKDVFFLE